MNYIVNPAIFYWMSVLDSLKGVSVALLVLSVISIVFLIAIFSIDGWSWDEEDKERFKKIKRIVVILLTVTSLIVIFVPGEKTVVEMLIAKFATVENAGMTIDAIKGIVDYIVEAMKTL